MSRGKILLGMGFSTVLAVSAMVENRQLLTTKYIVSSKKLPKNFDGKKILHLSDLHKKRYGDGYNNLLNSCKVQEPDYIFFTGDLFSRCEKNLFPKLVLMKRLAKIAPVYYIMGNHETDVPEKSSALNERLKREGIHVLINESERLWCGDEYVNIYGTELPEDCYKNPNGGYNNLLPVTEKMLNGTLGKAPKDECNILLSHSPFPLCVYDKWGADFVFSGHCHGGSVRLPVVGGVLSPERKFFPKYTKGVYKLGDCKMILSAGLGKFRLGNPAEIVVVTLKKG